MYLITNTALLKTEYCSKLSGKKINKYIFLSYYKLALQRFLMAKKPLNPNCVRFKRVVNRTYSSLKFMTSHFNCKYDTLK